MKSLKKHLIKILLCAALAFLSATVVISAFDEVSAGNTFTDSDFPVVAEALVREGMPFGDQLSAFGREISITAGKREVHGYESGRNGIFVDSNGLMRNIDPPVEAYVEENIAGVAEFAQSMRMSRRQTYFVLIPTASAILQQNLPGYARYVTENQRRFIDDAYSRVSGAATTIDAYSALISRQNQYIYYRTEDNLTALGGFYVCSAILSRLGTGRVSLNEFDIEFTNNYFYGSLCKESGYKNVKPDVISVLRFSAANRASREFLVSHNNGEKIYHTLFPKHAPLLGSELDVFFGGMSPVIDIYNSAQYNSSILLFGDKTAVSYLPVLANYCARITFVDLSGDPSGYDFIDPFDYDKIIFAYGVGSFMHTNNPSKAAFL